MRFIVTSLPAIIPPLAVVPLYAIFMVITHRIDVGTWLPFQSLPHFLRALGFAYLLGLVFHAIYSTLVYLLARRLGVRSLLLWIAVYALPLVLLAFMLADTTSDLVGASVHVCFGLTVAFAAWPFMKVALGVSR